ncbi:MAG: TatD family hydrolase [Gammaproteobacteria bacterium]|nr:TatD family hydrolase [Gammaproteobacteria bacterium]
MFVDSHCHLDRLHGVEQCADIEPFLATADEHGVKHLLCVSINLEALPEVLEIAQRYASVSASVGVHPNEQEGKEPTVAQLVELATQDKVVAIGETGLDYFRSEGDLEWQRQRFRYHIAAAQACQKPLIVHSREAGSDTIRILREEGADKVGGVMHCFVDDWQMAEQAMALNFYISFSGIVTFKSAKQVQEVAALVPADRLLIETDSPYLAPVPHRSKSNQPAYVRHVAECIADLRGESLEQVATYSTENFFRLFKTAKPVSSAENIVLP